MTLRERVLAQLGRGSLNRSGASAPSGEHGAGAVEALRDTWSAYPAEWKQDQKLSLGYETLGEEWGGPAFADFIVDLVRPHLGPDVDVLELGCGGGKFSQRLAPLCRSLVCTDISEAMIEHTRESLTAKGLGGNVSYRVLNGRDFQGIPADAVDFIFSYDVLLHVQPQNVFSYLVDARRVLREGGVFMLHQINLASDGGMAHFLSQYDGATWTRAFDDPRRRGHIYFMSGDQMHALANAAGLPVEGIDSDPGEFSGVTAGRDLIGFLRRGTSRLKSADPGTIELVKPRDGHTIYAILHGKRVAIPSAVQFERAGLRWEQVRDVSEAELAEMPDGGSLEPWE